MSPRQLGLLTKLAAIKRNGVSITNMNGAIDTIVESLIYLVQNTPEAKE